MFCLYPVLAKDMTVTDSSCTKRYVFVLFPSSLEHFHFCIIEYTLIQICDNNLHEKLVSQSCMFFAFLCSFECPGISSNTILFVLIMSNCRYSTENKHWLFHLPGFSTTLGRSPKWKMWWLCVSDQTVYGVKFDPCIEYIQPLVLPINQA